MFELVVSVRDSKGKPTGKRQIFTSETGYGISCAWYKYVSNIPRKGKPHTQLPSGEQAEEILKEIYGD